MSRRKPSIVGRIGIVQPGLSESQLQTDVADGVASAIQIVQLLTVFRDSVLNIAEPVVLASP